MRTQYLAPTGLMRTLVDNLPTPPGMFQFMPPFGVMLAVNDSAIGQMYSAARENTPDPQANPVATITIRGPIYHHIGESPGCDSYDAIKARVRMAMESPNVQKVLLSIDSPGGLLSGCLDTVQELRMLSAKHDKPIFTYIDGRAESAAYALACAADYIFTPPTATVGCIGTVQTLVDQTKADAAMGIKYTVLYSGSRKADLNPHIEKSDVTIQAIQSEIDYTAQLFFNTVSTYRPRVSSQAVQDLQAASVIGQQAIDRGLADQLATEDQVLEILSSSAPIEPQQSSGAIMGFAEAMAAIQAIIDDESSTPEDKEKARKAIAACNTPSKSEAEAAAKAEGEPHPEPDDDNKGGPSDKDEDDKVEGKKALRALNTQVTDVARTALLASRTDFTPAQVKTLKRAPLATVQDAVENWPRVGAAATTSQASQAILAMNVRSETQPEPVAPSADGRPQGELSPQEQAMLARLGGGNTEMAYTDDDGYFCTPALTVQKQRELIDRARKTPFQPKAE